MSICAYAIFLNEEANVAAWAETTGDADHRFVLDTGSTDDTVGELERHGIDHARAVLEPFHFGDARNAALALVPSSIDWCLHLDADETLSEGWLGAFQDVETPAVRRYRYQLRNASPAAPWGVVMRSNLHARRGFRWRYPVHECLEPNAPARDVPGLVVEHHPDVAKVRSYLPALLAVAAADPHDRRMAFYAGRELWYAGRWQEAREQLTHFLELPNGWAPERAEAWRIIAAMDIDPERWLWRAAGESPERREVWVDLARHHLEAGHAELARAMITVAATRTREDIYTTSRDCWGEAFDELVAELVPAPEWVGD